MSNLPAGSQQLTSLQKAWTMFMTTLGTVNMQRARDARRFDNHLRDILRRY